MRSWSRGWQRWDAAAGAPGWRGLVLPEGDQTQPPTQPPCPGPGCTTAQQTAREFYANHHRCDGERVCFVLFFFNFLVSVMFNEPTNHFRYVAVCDLALCVISSHSVKH